MAPTLENRDVQYLNSIWKQVARLWEVDRKMLHCITGGVRFDIIRHQYRWLETEAGREAEQERGQAMACHCFTDSMVHLILQAPRTPATTSLMKRELGKGMEESELWSLSGLCICSCLQCS